MSKAIEAAAEALRSNTADCEPSGMEAVQAAIRAYLTALAEDEAAVDWVAAALVYPILEWGLTKEGLHGAARAAIRAMGGE